MTTASTPIERLDDAIAQGAPHFRPILSAVKDEGCRYMMVPQTRYLTTPIEIALRSDGPLIAVIGDDAHSALGPAGFNGGAVRDLIKASGAVVVVACEALPTPYLQAASFAVLKRQNVTIVETLPDREQEWLALIEVINPGVPTLLATVQHKGRTN